MPAWSFILLCSNMRTQLTMASEYGLHIQCQEELYWTTLVPYFLPRNDDKPVKALLWSKLSCIHCTTTTVLCFILWFPISSCYFTLCYAVLCHGILHSAMQWCAAVGVVLVVVFMPWHDGTVATCVLTFISLINNSMHIFTCILFNDECIE
jgi:hypothetical protein